MSFFTKASTVVSRAAFLFHDIFCKIKLRFTMNVEQTPHVTPSHHVIPLHNHMIINFIFRKIWRTENCVGAENCQKDAKSTKDWFRRPGDEQAAKENQLVKHHTILFRGNFCYFLFKIVFTLLIVSNVFERGFTRPSVPSPRFSKSSRSNKLLIIDLIISLSTLKNAHKSQNWTRLNFNTKAKQTNA